MFVKIERLGAIEFHARSSRGHPGDGRNYETVLPKLNPPGVYLNKRSVLRELFIAFRCSYFLGFYSRTCTIREALSTYKIQ